MEYWRDRRLYDRRPLDLGWVQTTWMLGGLPLAILLNVWVLPALPLPQRTRRRIEVVSAVFLAALVVLALGGPLALALGGMSPSAASWPFILFAPGVAVFALYAVFGTALGDAYRALLFWRGSVRVPVVFFFLPLLVGMVVDTVVFWPLVWLGVLIGGLA